MSKTRTEAVTPDQFQSFGELLRFLRRRAGLTQLDLSVAVGYSEGQISRLEHDERAPDAATLAARFVPALSLEQEPEWAARLLELGKDSREDRRNADPTDAQATLNNLPLQLSSFVGREK